MCVAMESICGAAAWLLYGGVLGGGGGGRVCVCVLVGNGCLLSEQAGW